ncbi:hypothetical protein K469DRAFT_718663 [Zopfia rhizophila CBS 207.26]|uniref:Heterokaryon incompatibility domain-containing protein n=1 Tax=Zopfia rhizophila CBS 207.26 TaxID=1314779 RepID=A0A6A6EL21_9PEZI|nr:hypothetical protein K469DRAFT_718663 [Zopfia rhizophila CBS 207.26]
MDHVPLPKDPQLHAEEVDYLLTKDDLYDGLGFLTYPERKGWSTKDIFSAEAFAQTVHTTSTFIQAWLWFGLGHEVLGPSFTPEKFVRRNANGDPILSTQGLLPLAKQWIQSQHRLSPHECSKRCRHLSVCLQRSERAIITLEGEEEYMGKLYGSVARSVLVLAEFLMEAIKKAYPLDASETLLDLHWDCLRAGGRKYFERILADPEKRWCKSEPRKLSIQANSIATLNYYANLQPPSWSRFSTLRKNHTDCTEDSCKAYQINPVTYETRHAVPDTDCGCLKASADTEKIGAILKQGSIPILCVESDSSHDNVQLRVEACRPNRRYVAISHVWADGMGDPKSNALPSCQLKKLKGLIDTLPRDKPSEHLGVVEALAGLCKRLFLILSKNESLHRELAQMFCTAYSEDGLSEMVSETYCFDVVDGDFGIQQMLRMATRSRKLMKMIGKFMRLFMGDERLRKELSIWAQEVERIMEAMNSLDDDTSSHTSDDYTSDDYTSDDLSRILSSANLSDLDGSRNRHNHDEDLGLWIDTICCPVAPDGDEQLLALKLLAISKLKQTYEDAEHVLVIDTYLESIDSSSLSDLELLMRIFVSGWTRRLWTLQEGVMANRLWFQFADRAVELSPLFRNFQNNHDLNEAPLLHDVENMMDQLVVFRGKEGFLARSGPSKLWNALRCRSVSYPPDEVLCIANLMNIDISHILEENKVPTMENLWDQMASIPSAVIFWICPRLATPGYHWAPSTFLGRNTSPYFGSGPLETKRAKLRVEGLQVELPGFYCPMPLPASKHFHMHDDSGTWYCVSRNGYDSSKDAVKSAPIELGTQWAIIISQIPAPEQHSRGEEGIEITEHQPWRRAQYVEIKHFEAESATTFVRMHSNLSVKLLADADMIIPAARSCAQEVEKEIAQEQIHGENSVEDLLARRIKELLEVMKWEEVRQGVGHFGQVGDPPSEAYVERFKDFVKSYMKDKSFGIKVIRTVDTQRWVVD